MAESKKTVLLSGGNPQIAKGYGEEPINAYIAAMPGWKSDVERQIDDIVTNTVPGVVKAVKWNSPFYGTATDLWFMNLHCFDKYIKVAFFRGASLEPVPPETSKHAETRYFHIREGDDFADRLTGWIRQAAKLPGERM